MSDVAARLVNRVQLTTDGHIPYLEAVEGVFGDDVDIAQLVKMYGKRYPRWVPTVKPRIVMSSVMRRRSGLMFPFVMGLLPVLK